MNGDYTSNNNSVSLTQSMFNNKSQYS